MLFDPGACCACTSSGVTIQVRLCGAPVPAGTTVEVYSNSSKTVLLASGVTDASGNYFWASATGGGRYFWVPSFSAQSGDTGVSLTVTAPGTVTINVQTSSAYTCGCGPCASLPISGTLHATVGWMTGITLTSSFGQYNSGPMFFDYPGCGGCSIGEPYPFRIRLQFSLACVSGGWYLTIYTCLSTPTVICPRRDIGGTPTCYTYTGIPLIVSCSGGAASGSVDPAWVPDANAKRLCLEAASITVSE